MDSEIGAVGEDESKEEMEEGRENGRVGETAELIRADVNRVYTRKEDRALITGKRREKATGEED